MKNSERNTTGARRRELAAQSRRIALRRQRKSLSVVNPRLNFRCVMAWEAIRKPGWPDLECELEPDGEHVCFRAMLVFSIPYFAPGLNHSACDPRLASDCFVSARYDALIGPDSDRWIANGLEILAKYVEKYSR